MISNSDSPRWVWCDRAGKGRNVFALFRRRFSLATLVKSSVLHLFVDGLYRLRVNGRVVGCGPARFAPSHPEYDTYDLHDLLVPGINEILVEAHATGTSSFQPELRSWR